MDVVIKGIVPVNAVVDCVLVSIAFNSVVTGVVSELIKDEFGAIA